MNKIKTHCLQGHLLTNDENVYKSKSGVRLCLKCDTQRYALRERGYEGTLPRLTCHKGHSWVSENIICSGLMGRHKKCRICENDNRKKSNENNILKRQPGIEERKLIQNNTRLQKESDKKVESNKRKIKAFQDALSSKRRYLYEYKMCHPCTKCGVKDVRVLDFHHKNPKTKLFELANNKSKTVPEVINEIRKCIILCKNCHAKHHIKIPKFSSWENLWKQYGCAGSVSDFCCQLSGME
jgi:hypothetical protein